jgi:hypothetical protein
MTHEQRRELLERKLAENTARRAREAFLASLPAEYRDYLAVCPIVQGERATGVASWLWVGEQGLGYTELHQPPGYSYSLSGWSHKLLARIAALGDTHDAADAYFWFRGNPIYEVTFGWVRTRFAALYALSPENLGVVRQDFQAGIVMNSYWDFSPGCVLEDPNPDEVARNLGVWGFNRQQATI